MTPAQMANLESATQLVLAFNEAFNQHNVAGMMKLTTSDTVFENTHPAPNGTRYEGKEAVTQFWQSFFNESANAHIEIEEIFGLGNHCVMRWTYSWGDGHVRGVDIFKVRDGLISEKLSYVKG